MLVIQCLSLAMRGLHIQRKESLLLKAKSVLSLILTRTISIDKKVNLKKFDIAREVWNGQYDP